MNLLLTDILKQLDLQPGERRSVLVDDYCVILQREEEASVTVDETPIAGFFLNVPLSPNAVKLVLKRGEPQFPERIEITESDLAPE